MTFRPFPPFPRRGESYEENAVGKAVHYSRHTDHLTLADDSGLEVDCLGGIPGVRSARFGGEEAGSAEKCRKILSLLAGVPTARRPRWLKRCFSSGASSAKVLPAGG